MAFDGIGFFQHYGIEYVENGTKWSREGWVQLPCWCIGNPGFHLGFEIATGRFNCYRCGFHRTWDAVLTLLNNDVREAKSAMIRFKGRPVARTRKEKKDLRILEIPSGLQPLTKRARKYLEGRKFDPDLLDSIWRLQSTSNIGELKHRIFIPFFLVNRMVTWQTRDITGLSPVKYLAQSETKEIVSNKSTLYGLDQSTSKSCIIVEGVSDVWRLGPGSVSLQGIKYKPAQVQALIKNFERHFILFDPENQATEQAERLAHDISSLGGKPKLIDLDVDCDPGDLDQDDADYLMRELLGNHAGY